MKGENSGKLTEPRDAFDTFGGRVCEESGQALAQISEPRGPKERFEGGMLRQRRSGNKGQGTVAAKNARHQHRNEGRWGRLCLLVRQELWGLAELGAACLQEGAEASHGGGQCPFRLSAGALAARQQQWSHCEVNMQPELQLTRLHVGVAHPALGTHATPNEISEKDAQIPAKFGGHRHRPLPQREYCATVSRVERA